MPVEFPHEVIRDATLSLAHLLKARLPKELQKRREVEVVFEPPEPQQVAEAKTGDKVLVSLLLIDVTRSTLRGVWDPPVAREEDADGNLVEYKPGITHFIMPRYLFTPWTGGALSDQEVLGCIIRLFFNYTALDPSDMHGKSIPTTNEASILEAPSFNVDSQMRFWQCLGRPYRPSAAYSVHLGMTSMSKRTVKRVKERVLDFRKLEG